MFAITHSYLICDMQNAVCGNLVGQYDACTVHSRDLKQTRHNIG